MKDAARQGISKTGNPRLRTTMVELAWMSGENLIERLQAPGEQAVRVPILRRARPGCDRCRQPVALKDVDPLKVLGQGAGSRQPADPGADNNSPPA
jgi:hypothetical protein